MPCAHSSLEARHAAIPAAPRAVSTGRRRRQPHPSSQTVTIGQSVTFRVTASGSPPLSYQWQRNGVDIPGATSSSYTLPLALPTDDGARFRVRVTNGAGSATSNEAVLTVTLGLPLRR